jgi:hypothetical protein
MIGHSGDAWYTNNKHRNGWTLRGGLWTASDQVVVPPDADLRRDVLLCLHDMGAHIAPTTQSRSVLLAWTQPS